MRIVELSRVAIAAETLYLRRVARRQALRVAFAVVAAVFALALLATLHALIYIVANIWLAPIWSICIVLLVDIIATGVFGAMAWKGAPDSVETEAKQLRQQAVRELKKSLTAMGIAAEVASTVLQAGARSGLRRGASNAAGLLAARLLGR